MTKKYCRYSKEQLRNALEEARRGTATAVASRMFGVPRATIISKIKGIYPEDCKSGKSTTLTEVEETILKNWIISVGKTGFPVTKDQLLDSVAQLVKNLKRENDFHEGRPGRKWYEGFLRRHPEISLRMTQNLTSTRASITEVKIRSWFKEIESYFSSNNILINEPERVFNADEAGFCLAPKGKQVLVKKGSKSVYNFANANEKESITTLVTGNAAGHFAPPMVIFSYDRIPKHIAMQFPEKWGLGKSENGWMTSETFFEYVSNIFYPWVLENGIKLPVILYVDGHKSHLTMELSKFCSDKGIILVSLVPNATHILQPMDVGVFHPLKNKWRQAISKWRLENKKQTLKKENFAPLLKESLESLDSKTILKNSFRKCGLFPFSENSVDYSKCLMTVDDFDQPVAPALHQAADTSLLDINNKKPIIEHLDFLEKRIGPEKITLFKKNIGNNWQGNTEEKSLFKIWYDLTEEAQDNIEDNADNVEKISDQENTVVPNVIIEDCIVLEGDWINKLLSGTDLDNKEERKNETPTNGQEIKIGDDNAPIPCDPKHATNIETHDLEQNKEQDTEIVKPSLIDITSVKQNDANIDDERRLTPTDVTPKKQYPSNPGSSQSNTPIITSVKQNDANIDEERRLTPTDVTPKKQYPSNPGSSQSNTPIITSVKQNDANIDEERRLTPTDVTPKKQYPSNPGSSQSNTPIIPSPFKNILFWPSGSTDRKKFKSKEKIPSVCTSDKWKEYYQKKENEKIKKEEEVKERKRKREEVKAEKELKKILKKDVQGVSQPKATTSSSTVKKRLAKNDYVIVDYESNKYPGRIVTLKKDSAVVSVMATSGLNRWKWPQPTDELEYGFKDILEQILEPKPVNNRNNFVVPEIEKYENYVT